MNKWRKLKTTGNIPAWSTKEPPLKSIWIVESLQKGYGVVYEVRSDFDKPTLKTFKTKQQALKYARNYMRKH